MCNRKECNNYSEAYINGCRTLKDIITNCPFFKTKEQHQKQLKKLGKVKKNEVK